MTHIIKVYDLAVTRLYGYLAKYDPDQPTPHGTVEFTDDPKKALTFPGLIEALACWKQQSKTTPIRNTDGKPNCPLTAFSVEVLLQEDAPLIVREP